MIEINGKVYRNIQEQVQENMDDIEDLDTRVTALEETPSQTYTEGAGIDILNNVISVDNTIVPFKADLATVASTGSYTDLSNKPNLSIYAEKAETVTKDENGNVNGVLQVAQLESNDYDEDDDCKADIYLSSGLRRSTITLETEGEETGSSIILQGTTSVGSEGIIDLHGETRVFTDSRITVIDGNDDTEEIAYLSDITGGGSQLYQHSILIRSKKSSADICYCTLTIISSSSTQINTIALLDDYLSTNGFIGDSVDYMTNILSANGVWYENSYEYDIKGMTSDGYGSPVILATIVDSNIIDYNTVSLSNTSPYQTTITDKVITL